MNNRRGGGKFQVRKSEVDGDSPRFLFRQAVWIRARQRFDQCALAVIHMACGGQNEVMKLAIRIPLYEPLADS